MLKAKTATLNFIYFFSLKFIETLFFDFLPSFSLWLASRFILSMSDFPVPICFFRFRFRKVRNTRSTGPNQIELSTERGFGSVGWYENATVIFYCLLSLSLPFSLTHFLTNSASHHTSQNREPPTMGVNRKR